MLSAVAPIAPPREWFFTAEPEGLQPMRYSADGRVTGHLAPWETCHMGFVNGAFAECVKAPRSRTDYQFFHVGSMETEEGDLVGIGKLTYDTDHAPVRAGLQAASRHYDNTGSVGAFVRAIDGRYGIWLSGAVRSDLPAEGLRDLRANGPSGDWRHYNGNLELIASLSVPVQGFPIPGPQLALAASAHGEQEVTTLILPPFTEADVEENSRSLSRIEYLRERETITASLV